MEWYVKSAITKTVDERLLESKYWVKKNGCGYVFRPLLNSPQLQKMNSPKVEKPHSILFSILESFNFKSKGVVVLPGFYKLKQTILKEIDTETIIFTDREGYFKDSRFKSIVQNFSNLDTKIKQNFDFYIYDFTKDINYELLTLPFKLILEGNITSLPYIIVFTNILSDDDFKQLSIMFGNIKLPKYTYKPLCIYDYRNTVKNRGKFDENYLPLTEIEVIDYYIKLIEENTLHKIFNDTTQITNKDYSNIIVFTTEIDYAAIEFTKLFKCNTIIISDITSKLNFHIFTLQESQIPDYYYDIEELDQEDKPEYILSDFVKSTCISYNTCNTNLRDYQIIIIHKDCIDQLPDLNINRSYILDTNFEWNLQKRIELIQLYRSFNATYLLTYSAPLPTTLHSGAKLASATVLYDLEYESKIFSSYNIKQNTK
jgi:hypothetical protein